LGQTSRQGVDQNQPLPRHHLSQSVLLLGSNATNGDIFNATTNKLANQKSRTTWRASPRVIRNISKRDRPTLNAFCFYNSAINFLHLFHADNKTLHGFTRGMKDTNHPVIMHRHMRFDAATISHNSSARAEKSVCGYSL